MALAAYFYFMVRDPSRLHSEDFLIEHQRLMLEQKGVAERFHADAMVISGNPETEIALTTTIPDQQQAGRIKDE